MPCSRWKSQIHWVLAGALLMTSACNGEGREESQSAAEGDSTAAIQQPLTITDNATLQLMVANMSHYAPDFKVKPVLNCIDKVSDTKYVAHFGYNNTSGGTKDFDLGPLNRFFPDPSNRGQATVFNNGVKSEQFTVPFDGNLLVWGLDGNATYANKQSPLCPKQPPRCPSVCDDKNPCTADLCDATTGFKCVHKARVNGTSCGDGNACNGDEICRDGVCKGGKPLVCADGNPCTANICDPRRGCVFVPRTDGTSCPVSGNCGFGGTCKAGVCNAKTPNCDDHNPCTADSCGANNSCTHTPLAVGTSCSNGNFCDGAEVCNAQAQCKAKSRPDCDDHNVCTVDSCLIAGGCGHVPGHDGRKCTTSGGTAGKCDDGICQPTTTVCNPDGNPCHLTVIDPVTGACTHPDAADDTTCSDNNACTQKDVCKSGVCTGTNPVVCGGATACMNAGTCNPATGLCANGTNKPNGGACDDNNLCTSNDVCSNGQCKGTALACPGDQCHGTGTCDPATGVCFNPNLNNGTACNDSVKCTSGDVCTDGVCGGQAVVCQAADTCHDAGTCDEASGTCSNPVSPNGKTCSDGNACTQTDVCSNGVCQGSNPVTCPGATACTNASTCDSATGQCKTGTPRADGTTCDDGKKCTTTDVCKAGVCGGDPVTCVAADSCHDAGTCDETSGTCSNPASPNGKTCNDGNACTSGDACSAGVCLGGAPVVCNNGTACSAPGTCDPASGQCGPGPALPNGTSCDDGRKCTNGDVCTGGVCGGTTVSCPAPTACHSQGTCNEATGACTTPVAADGTACSDGNACTRTDVCLGGSCTGGNPVTCAAETACLFGGVCDPSTGTCSGTKPKPTGTACDDGLRCTKTDVCTGGTCGGTPVSCSAGQTCNESSGSCESLDACPACEQAHVVSGECDPKIGCANVTDPADRALCQALRDCMLTSGCWSNDPMDCLCGTAQGTDCLTDASNGACKAAVLAAVKDTDPANVATLFYSFQVPAGFATQQFGCDRDFCSAKSSPPSAACPVNVCPDDGNPCTKEVVVNNVCTHVVAADGASCNDGNACTQTDSCQAGVCKGTNPVQCTGGGACTNAGVCDATSGLCLGGAPKADGSPCDDGKNCTGNDVCTAGVCGGTAVSCQAPATCDESSGQCKVSCGQCEAKQVADGLCDPQIGCENITTGAADVALCVALRSCMLNNHCAGTDPFDCFCGTAQGTACITGANGPCKQQVLDATKSGTDLTNAGTKFYDFATPAGFATQQIACDHDFCGPDAPAPLTNSCPL
jgi:hypothetical protein